MSTVVMRTGGNIIEFSVDHGPLPLDVEAELRNKLTYTHLFQLRGYEAYDSLGNYMPTRTETRLLYKIDRRGRLVCSIGWQYQLCRMLTEFGFTVVKECIDPVHPRPNRFEVVWDRIFERMELRVKQDEMLVALESADHGILDVPPGVGKTHLIGAYILSHPYARVHIVTDGIDIIGRIYRYLTKLVANVGQVGGGKRRFGSHATVISADSLHVVGEGFDDPCSRNAPDVVLFDEVHRAGAPTTLTQLAKYKGCKMYGLSGTVGCRFDGADKQLEGLFGEVVYRMSYQEAEALKLVLPVTVEWIKMDFDHPESQGKRGTVMDRWGLWRNEERNRRIAEKAREFTDDTQVLIMVATVEHAVALKQYLPEFRLCYDHTKAYDTYIRTGQLNAQDEPLMTPQRRAQMREQFEEGTLKKVIATDVWSTGVDFVSLSVLIRADGRASEILDTQIPGRAVRIAEGKEGALLIDCMDGFNDTLLRRSNVRKRNYINKGWTQVGIGRRRHGVSASKWNK